MAAGSGVEEPWCCEEAVSDTSAAWFTTPADPPHPHTHSHTHTHTVVRYRGSVTAEVIRSSSVTQWQKRATDIIQRWRLLYCSDGTLEVSVSEPFLYPSSVCLGSIRVNWEYSPLLGSTLMSSAARTSPVVMAVTNKKYGCKIFSSTFFGNNRKFILLAVYCDLL